jgi:hypothetical protein
MDNTRTTLTAIVAVLTAATLVVGLTVAATITPSTAFADGKKDGLDKYMKGGGQDGYKKKGKQANGGKDNNGSNNGNTNTIQVLKQNAKASGKHSEVDQNGQNVICTHPSTTSPETAGSCTSQSTSQSNQPPQGVCDSPLVEAHVGSETGDLICVDPSDLNPTNGQSGKCGGNEIDVFVDSTHLCLPTKAT